MPYGSLRRRPRPAIIRRGATASPGGGITSRTPTVVDVLSGTSITGTLPTDRVAGDYVVAHFSMSCTVAQFTGPGGSWVQIVTPTNNSIAGEMVAAYGMFDPPSAPTATSSGAAGKQTCIVQAYGGVDTTTPIDATAVLTAPGTLPLALTSVTTVTAGARLIAGLTADFSTGTWTIPGTMTLVGNHTSGTGRGGVVADEPRPAIGATGTRTFTASNLQAAVGYMLALRPAVGGGGPAASGAGASTQRSETSATVVKRSANVGSAVQRAATAVAITKQGAGAGAAVQRAATASAGVKNATAVGRAEQHTQTVAAKAAPFGAAVAAGRAATSSAGGKGGGGAGLAVQRSASASSVRKGGVGAASPAQRSTAADAGVKGGVGAGVAAQHSSSADAGFKATAGAGAAVTRSNTRATTAVQIGGVAAAATRSAATSAGKRGTAGTATASVRAVAVGAGKAGRLGGAVVATHAVTAVSIVHGGVGAARAQGRSQTVATFSPAYVPALVDVGGSSGWAGAPDRDAASGALTDGSAGTGSVPDVGSAGGSSPDQGSAAGALVG